MISKWSMGGGLCAGGRALSAQTSAEVRRLDGTVPSISGDCLGLRDDVRNSLEQRPTGSIKRPGSSAVGGLSPCQGRSHQRKWEAYRQLFSGSSNWSAWESPLLAYAYILNGLFCFIQVIFTIMHFCFGLEVSSEYFGIFTQLIPQGFWQCCGPGVNINSARPTITFLTSFVVFKQNYGCLGSISCL